MGIFKILQGHWSDNWRNFHYPSISSVTFRLCLKIVVPVSEFNEFEPRLKSAKNRFQLSAGFNLEKFNSIFSMEPTIFEPRNKFKPRLKLFKFGLCILVSCGLMPGKKIEINWQNLSLFKKGETTTFRSNCYWFETYSCKNLKINIHLENTST